MVVAVGSKGFHTAAVEGDSCYTGKERTDEKPLLANRRKCDEERDLPDNCRGTRRKRRHQLVLDALDSISLVSRRSILNSSLEHFAFPVSSSTVSIHTSPRHMPCSIRYAASCKCILARTNSLVFVGQFVDVNLFNLRQE